MEMWRRAIGSQITSVFPCRSDKGEEDRGREWKEGREGKRKENAGIKRKERRSWSSLWEVLRGFLEWGISCWWNSCGNEKSHDAWLMLPPLTPNGKINPAAHTIFWTLRFFAPRLTHDAARYYHSISHPFPPPLNFLLLDFPLTKSPPLFFLLLVLRSSGWPCVAAASEVAKVQSQYEPTKLVKY